MKVSLDIVHERVERLYAFVIQSTDNLFADADRSQILLPNRTAGTGYDGFHTGDETVGDITAISDWSDVVPLSIFINQKPPIPDVCTICRNLRMLFCNRLP